MLAPNTNPNAIVIKGTYIANTSANNEKNKQRDKNNINSLFGMISDLARLMFRSKCVAFLIVSVAPYLR